ncbi:MAG: hypothetical protein WCS73_10935 [Lentisphaeria bacterium]
MIEPLRFKPRSLMVPSPVMEISFASKEKRKENQPISSFLERHFACEIVEKSYWEVLPSKGLFFAI